MVDKKYINNIIDYTVNEYYGLNNKCMIVKSSIYYDNAVALCEKYGLKLKQCTNDHLRFEETGHNNPLNEDITSTELRFDSMLHQDGLRNINFIDDYSDHENELYSLDEILGYFTSMPLNLKSGVGLMVFDDDDAPNHSVIYDPNLRRDNVVHITNDAYKGFTKYNGDVTHNPERIMGHEMGHCFEYSKLTGDEKQIVRKALNREPLTAQEKGILMGNIIEKINTYSTMNGLFYNAVMSETNNRPLRGIQTPYAQQSFMTSFDDGMDGLSEHFAESVSVVAFRDKTDKSNCQINTASLSEAFMGVSKNVGYDKYVSKQPQSSKVLEDLLFK